MQQLLAGFAKQAAMSAAKTIFDPCACEGCTRRSPGWSCVECKKGVCGNHAFATVPSPGGLKPEILCAKCITQVYLAEIYEKNPEKK